MALRIESSRCASGPSADDEYVVIGQMCSLWRRVKEAVSRDTVTCLAKEIIFLTFIILYEKSTKKQNHSIIKLL